MTASLNFQIYVVNAFSKVLYDQHWKTTTIKVSNLRQNHKLAINFSVHDFGIHDRFEDADNDSDTQLAVQEVASIIRLHTPLPDEMNSNSITDDTSESE